MIPAGETPGHLALGILVLIGLVLVIAGLDYALPQREKD